MRRALALFIALTAAVPALAANEPPPPSRAQLEQLYDEYRSALKAGGVQELKGLMSSYAFAARHNTLASVGMDMDAEALKRAGEHSTDLRGRTFLRLLHDGPTAALVFVGDAKEMGPGGDAAYVRFLMVKFAHEGGSWKVEEAVGRVVEKLKEDGTARRFEDLGPEPEFAIDGVVKPAPELLPKADYGAVVNVQSQGYRTVLTVNGVEAEPVEDGSFAGTLVGGLRKGANTVRIAATPLKEGGTVELTLDAFRRGDPPKRVFTYAPAGAPRPEHVVVIEVP